jgi:hypothetical protein
MDMCPTGGAYGKRALHGGRVENVPHSGDVLCKLLVLRRVQEE